MPRSHSKTVDQVLAAPAAATDKHLDDFEGPFYDLRIGMGVLVDLLESYGRNTYPASGSTDILLAAFQFERLQFVVFKLSDNARQSHEDYLAALESDPRNTGRAA